jgi:hypothetical protein
LVRKVKINNQWFDSEIVKSNVNLFKQIGIPIT